MKTTFSVRILAGNVDDVNFISQIAISPDKRIPKGGALKSNPSKTMERELVSWEHRGSLSELATFLENFHALNNLPGSQRERLQCDFWISGTIEDDLGGFELPDMVVRKIAMLGLNIHFSYFIRN
jgi:hypothetical protein